MPYHPTKNLDVLVQAHRIGRQRRSVSLPRWERKIQIKRFLSETEDDAVAQQAGKSIAGVLRARLSSTLFDPDHVDFDSEIDEIVDALEGVSAVDDDWSATDDLNARLEELYDWADLHSIWLE